MQSKQCPKCGEVKPVSMFSRNRQRRDGLNPQCKECVSRYARAYYEEHKEKHSARMRAYHSRNREKSNSRNRSYYAENKEELNAQITKRARAITAASREVATRNGELWTSAEDHVVFTSEGTDLEVAIELSRTVNSVRVRRCRLRGKVVA